MIPGKSDRQSIVYLAMGFEIIGLMVAALFLGQMLDEKYELRGLGTVGMMVTALVGFIAHISIIVFKQSGEEKSPEK